MKPNIWGPHAWIFLHSITFDYPDKPTTDTKRNYKNFFENIQYVLPCDMCRIHYKKNLKKFKITDKVLSSRKNLIEWLIDLHNRVNKMNNKPQLSYKDVVNKYLDFYEGNKNENINLSRNMKTSITPNIMIIISILLITIFIIKKKIYT